MDNIYIVLDINNKTPNYVPPFNPTVGDNNLTTLNITLVNNGVPFDLTGLTAKISLGKSDGTSTFADMNIVNAAGGSVNYALQTSDIAAAGQVNAEVVLYDSNNGRLTSVSFEFDVKQGILNESTVQSSNNFSALTQAISEVTDFSNVKQEVINGRQGYASLLTNLQNKDSQLADVANQSNDVITSVKSKFLPLDGFLGINGSGSGIGWGSYAIGFRNCRTGLGWDTAETTLGVYNWTSLDSDDSLAQANHEKLYINLCNNNTLYGASSSSDIITTQQQINGFIAFVTACANRYKNKGYMYGFWNEPDVPNYYNSTAYMNVVSQMYNAIKSQDSTAIVCFPELGGETTWFADVCSQGLLNYTDVVSIHLYSNKPEDLIDNVNKFKKIIKRYSDVDVPIYTTEYGWSSAPGLPYNVRTNVDEATRAKYVLRYILTALYCGIEKALIYTTRTARTNTTNDQDWFGIYDTNGLWSDLPIAAAIRNFTTNNLSCYFIGREMSNKNDYIMKLMDSSTNTMKYAVWTTGNSHNIILPTGDTVALTDTVQVVTTTKKLDIFDIIGNSQYGDYTKRNTGIGYNSEIYNDLDNNITSGFFSHAEGQSTSALFGNSHSQNYQTVAGGCSHSEGNWSVAYPGTLHIITSVNATDNTLTLDNITDISIGDTIIVKNPNTKAVQVTVTAINSNTITVDKTINVAWYYVIKAMGGSDSHAGGMHSIASGTHSFSHGFGTIADVYGGVAIGRYNKRMNGDRNNYSGTGDAFAIGNGDAGWVTSNAFRVTFDGKTYGLSSFNSSGADYAEYFEWLDENINNEDRVGYFVTLDGEKIRKANSNDNYILGIVSATPSVIGDSCQDDWQGKYVTDEWGRIQYQNVEVDEILDDKGNIISPKHTETRPIINTNWDSKQKYISRENRKEWSAIGMIGKLLVRDDGTCVVNGYCKPNDNGIATKGDIGYRVMKRLSNNIILVLFK